MAEEKVTIMVLKVDLECTKCYKKVKKLLCKYPQIRDQLYDEKANTVTIKVVCCSPEKIRDKLCCKGGGTIKSIEIKEPPKPKAPEPQKPKPAPEPEKTKPSPPPAEPEKPKTKQVVVVVPPKDAPPAKAPEAAAPPPKAPAPKAPEPAPAPVPIGYPQGLGYPQYGMSYPPYGYNTCGNGGMGVPAPPPCNCGCGGSRVVSNDNYGRNYCVNRCDYFSEENPAACTVM